MSWMSKLAKKNENTPKNAKQQQPTENQNNNKYQNFSWTSFYI